MKTKPKKSAKKARARKKILIIEDNRSLILALSEKFKREKFEVLTAYNGKTGLKAALGHKPDIILLDLLMPVMDGTTMLKHLRKDEWGKNVFVVMLTNKEPDSSLLNEAERLPYASTYLMKDNYDLASIVKIVKNKIANS